MINYNGRYFEDSNSVLKSIDHSYRYGDGLFETIKVVDGNILYKEYHFERLYAGLKILKFDMPPAFTIKNLEAEIIELCMKNNCEKIARVRLSVSRGNGGVYDCDNKFSYLVECWPLERKANLNEDGLIIDVFPDARKSIDAFSNLKSANYLPYIMAAVWAKENKLDDALVLNHHNRICDATIANIFWIKNDNIFTPPLSEGGIAGVMRRIILERFQGKESLLTEDILLNSDEVFLTNVITRIRWVKQCRDKHYQNTVSEKIFNKLTQAISS